jgi:hydroxymethylpyrimidine pyrophosphatase-like HAD family hydrolase
MIANVVAVLRALYVDLDGTLLGPGGSLLTRADGSFSLDGVRALEACARAGVEVVIYSGRRLSSVAEDARLMGQRSYIFELGAGLVLDGELEWLTGGCVPSAQAGTIHQQIAASGAPARLLEAFAGRLEYHVPWSNGREVSHLFRGQVDSDEVAAVLADGHEWLRLVDNGVMAAHGGTAGFVDYGLSDDVERVHGYHLVPAVASKARAVARHMQNRGYQREQCIACGDSREDMDAAEVVGTFWMMSNGLTEDPTLCAEVTRAGARVTTEPFGAGVYEAVVTTLAEG